MSIPVVVQHRHVHLSEADFRVLFGEERMEALLPLSHKGQFVSRNTVTVRGKNGHLEEVRILGPFRQETQVELSASEAFALGINAPVRISGDLAHSGTCTLIGPKGQIDASNVAIVPARHLHCSPQDAGRLGVAHHDTIRLSIKGQSGSIEHVTVRVHPTFSLEFHLSTDEAAEFWLQTGDTVTVP